MKREHRPLTRRELASITSRRPVLRKVRRPSAAKGLTRTGEFTKTRKGK